MHKDKIYPLRINSFYEKFKSIPFSQFIEELFNVSLNLNLMRQKQKNIYLKIGK